MSVKRSPNQRVKINDVARQAGVSTATVSRVINGTGTVSENTAKKVNQAISSLKFVAHGSARGLAGSKTHTIGLVLPGLTTFFFTTLIQGINDCIYNRDYSLLMYSVNTPASMISGKPLPLGEHNTDGLIVFTDFLDDYSIQYMHDQDLPIVMLHSSPPVELNIPKIMFENEEGACDVVNHLIKMGNKKIVYLRGPEGNEDSRQRELGYRRALTANNIEIDENLIGRGNFASGRAEDEIIDMLNRGVKFDAIFAGNDDAAAGVYRALRKQGFLIPEDIAVAGFDDDYMAQYISPALTTVKAPVQKSGFEAARILLDLIDGKPTVNEVRLQTELVIRESTKRGNHV